MQGQPLGIPLNTEVAFVLLGQSDGCVACNMITRGLCGDSIPNLLVRNRNVPLVQAKRVDQFLGLGLELDEVLVKNGLIKKAEGASNDMENGRQ